LQLAVIPDWIGVGVAIPLVGLGMVDVVLAVLEGVGVDSGGMPQFCSTQYEFPSSSVHVDLIEGFCIPVSE
jgi:hypothetical protein